ncbi:hypothetical protein EYC80_000839 [Monilinia laxa]|uniref:Uncharacterized protein n=1 Tax=Monilinia laxa TaxID=61186 RepID=A0A5N6K867_MONLA|nr:hypothetical protein EYC80_000839 [Monilinia laxa]
MKQSDIEMISTEPDIINSPRKVDSKGDSPLAETGRKSSIELCDSDSSFTSKNPQSNIPVQRMADPSTAVVISSINFQRSQNNPGTKRSRSPSPFSADPQGSPLKKQMFTMPIKPWIKNEHLFKKVQEKLAFYGLGPYDVPVLSDRWLPFNVQAKILTLTQNVLEEALFEFLYEIWPEVCVENGWEEMGEAELNELATAMIAGMQTHKDDIKEVIDHENSQISDSLSDLLEKIGQIRHCAVHRTKKIPVIMVEYMVRDASYITMYLKDIERTKILDNLCRPLEPLPFNLQARFGDKLQVKVERKLQKTSVEIDKIKEALRVEEEIERLTQLQLEHIKAQDEGIYGGELEALKGAL